MATKVLCIFRKKEEMRFARTSSLQAYRLSRMANCATRASVTVAVMVPKAAVPNRKVRSTLRRKKTERGSSGMPD